MDALKKYLVGIGGFDPNINALETQFNALKISNTSDLTSSITNATSTANILNSIPGVTDDTKKQMAALLDESKKFSTSGLSPSAIAAKTAEVNTKTQELVRQAQVDAKAAKEKAEADAKAAAQEKKENQKFSFKRLMKRAWDHGKWWLLGITLGLLALWGGSISSNNAIAEPVYMRFYYLIYGSLLFPVSFVFAIMRWFTGVKGSYYAILAPLVEGPIKNPFYASLLYMFTFDPGTVVIQINPVKPEVAPESTVLAAAAANSAAQAEAEAQAAAQAAAQAQAQAQTQAQAQAKAAAPPRSQGPLSSAPPGSLPGILGELSPNALAAINRITKRSFEPVGV